MPSENFVQNIDMGPGKTSYGGEYLGRTSGETAFNYGIETEPIETEEDGVVDEVVNNDALTVTVPIFETDVDTLALVIPWAVKDQATGTLHIGKAIGTRLSQFAKQVEIEPLQVTAGSKKLVIHQAYPKPGPVNFGYSRNGKRVANIQFVAIRDSSKPAGKDFFDVVPMTPKCEPVYANPDSGQYATSQSVELSCATTGASIYYTIDGSTPDETGTLYNAAITVDSPQIIKAIAIKDEFEDSDVAEFYYVGSLTP